MPLQKGKSKRAFQKSIAKEVKTHKANKSDQAIADSEQRRPSYKPNPERGEI